MRTSRPQPRIWLAFALASVVFGGCGDTVADPGATAPTGSFVGAVEGTTAMAGLVRDGDAVAAYVCGHEDTLQTHTRWFSGAVGADGAAFSLGQDGWTLIGSFVGDNVGGTLTDPDGASSTIMLGAAATGSLSGLYSVLDSGCRAGLIVIDPGDASAPAAQGAWCDDSGLIKQVTPMMPVAMVDGSIEVAVDGTDPAQMLPMSPHSL